MAVAAYGQQDGVTAEVPFNFAVRGRTLPAGTYTIQRTYAENPNMLELRNEQGAHPQLYAPVQFTSPEDGSKLVFDRCGERYFLREVWTPRGRHVLGESKEEMRLVHSEQSSVVAVAAGRR